MKNMIPKFLTLLGAIFLLTLLSCSTRNSLSGQIVTNTREVPAFSSVNLAIAADVIITQGDMQRIEIEADEDVMDDIETVIHDDALLIKREEFNWSNLGHVVIRITMPEITGLTVTGSGSIVTSTAVVTDELGINVSGSGSIDIDRLSARSIYATITGSGDVNLAGSNQQSSLSITITGSGDIIADDLIVGNAEVNITGSGTARINAADELNTNITGSGDVLYVGNPLINASSTGSGKTKNIN